MDETMIFMPKSFLYNDLYLHNYGIKKCNPDHFSGPSEHDYFLIHYVLEGEGSIKIGNDTHYIKKGHGFLINPNTTTHYKASHSNPWTLCWVGFHGIQAENILNETSITMKSPIFHYNPEELYFQKLLPIITQEQTTTEDELKIHGLLYILLSTLVGTHPKEKTIRKQIKKEEYVHKVIEFIEMKYNDSKVTVSQIAEYIGLDRSYLSSLFKEYINSSIQEYLIHYRVNKASLLLDNSELSIGNIARAVGYEDPLLFSKMFKKYKGLSPKNYRIESHTKFAKKIPSGGS